MGISQITGVPFECMQEPSIARLWLVLRDLFLDLNQKRVKGNKLTNIKVSIDSLDEKERFCTGDLGEATIQKSGGPCVNSYVKAAFPDRQMDTWGMEQECAQAHAVLRRP